MKGVKFKIGPQALTSPQEIKTILFIYLFIFAKKRIKKTFSVYQWIKYPLYRGKCIVKLV